MKKFIAIFFLLAPGLCLAHSDHKISAPTINPQATLTPGVQIAINAYNFSKVQNYTGYFISGVVYDKFSSFHLVFESGKNVNGKFFVSDHLIKSNPLQKVSDSEQEESNAFFSGLKNFIPNKIVRSGFSFRNNMKLLRYDLLDSEKNTRMSFWYDAETGFLVQKAIYGNDGELKFFKIYLNLTFNSSSKKHRSIVKNPILFSVEKRHTKYDDLDDLEKAGEDCLSEH